MSQAPKTYDGNINTWIFEKICQYPGLNPNILDVGCWKGQLGKEVLKARSDCRFSGIEGYAPPADALAAGYVSVYPIDLNQTEDIRQAGGLYDIIVCGDVLEHTLDPSRVLDELKALLAPDGIILVSLPNICFIQNRITHLLGSWNYAPDGVGGIMDNTHYRFFSLQSMRQLFVQSGLRIIEYRGLGFIRSFLRILNPLVYLWPNLWAMQIVFLIKR